MSGRWIRPLRALLRPMVDRLFDGRPVQILTIVDCDTRELLSIARRVNLRAYQVTDVLDRLISEREKPRSLRVDNGPQFTGRILDQRTYLNGVEIGFTRLGKLTDTAYIEAFKSRIRAECLNASWFLSMGDARDRIEVSRSTT